jgi:hypothetical protein
VRKVHIQGKVWQYEIGHQFVVIQFPPPNQKKKFTIAQSLLVERTPDELDRGRWKKTQDGMIKPSDVKNYIEKNLSSLIARMDARKKK